MEILSEWSRSRNIPLILVGDRCESYVENLIDEMWLYDFSNPEGLLKDVQARVANCRLAPKACLSLGEVPVPVAAKIAAAYGISSNSHGCALNTRSKFLMRKKLKESGVSQPRCFAAPNLDAAQKIFRTEFLQTGKEAFLKPPIGTGSTFCHKLRTDADLVQYWDYFFLESWKIAQTDPLCFTLFNNRVEDYFLLIEDLYGSFSFPFDDVLGPLFPVHEVSVDGVCCDGNLFVFGLTDKLIPHDLDGREYMWRTSRLPRMFQEAIIQKSRRICSALEITNGYYCHSLLHVEKRKAIGGAQDRCQNFTTTRDWAQPTGQR